MNAHFILTFMNNLTSILQQYPPALMYRVLHCLQHINIIKRCTFMAVCVGLRPRRLPRDQFLSVLTLCHLSIKYTQAHASVFPAAETSHSEHQCRDWYGMSSSYGSASVGYTYASVHGSGITYCLILHSFVSAESSAALELQKQKLKRCYYVALWEVQYPVFLECDPCRMCWDTVES